IADLPHPEWEGRVNSCLFVENISNKQKVLCPNEVLTGLKNRYHASKRRNWLWYLIIKMLFNCLPQANC
ncbi:MAG: hypothetical protein ACK55Z_34780, partial [bacterium]